ncbi:NADPH-dependent FMN reductase [Nonomuraea endophytica]|uniref:NADPH-dependent FMN reductase n=1 Tax=Nonomuraea endophytica TaxID=714136 RepID=UPI0037C9703E
MSAPDRPVLQVIAGSIRPGRAGIAVARWIREHADKHGGFAVELVDLAEVGLPLLDEPHHPRLRRYVHPHTMNWSATVERAEAFVFVIPEYNHGVNAATKNALDYLVHEWAHKPAGLVGYGGVAGGARAVNSIKPTLSNLNMFPLSEGLVIPFVASYLDGEGEERRFTPSAEIEDAATAMLEALGKASPLLRRLRTA